MKSIKRNVKLGAVALLVTIFCICASALCMPHNITPKCHVLSDTTITAAGKKVSQADTLRGYNVIETYATDLSLRDSIIDFGRTLLGTPYVYAGCSTKGFDCSGFVYYVFNHFQIQVPRSSSGYKNFGTTIPIDRVQQGDVLVFLSPSRNEIGHLGIVTRALGMETEFIHASSGKSMAVIASSLKQEAYKKRFVKAVNVILE
jgi:cell wall-associated NlpC family hydrolase